MSLSRSYELTHRAMREQAQVLGVEPFAMRVVLCVYESPLDGRDTAQLEELLSVSGDQVRRAVRQLFMRGLATGPRPVRGRLTVVRLSPLAVDAARAIQQTVNGRV